MASKIDRDRARNSKKSTAFDVVSWSTKKLQESHHRREYYLPRIQWLREDALTDWEKGFLETIERQMHQHGNLTTKQMAWFDKIFQKYGGENGNGND